MHVLLPKNLYTDPDEQKMPPDFEKNKAKYGKTKNRKEESVTIWDIDI